MALFLTIKGVIGDALYKLTLTPVGRASKHKLNPNQWSRFPASYLRKTLDTISVFCLLVG